MILAAKDGKYAKAPIICNFLIPVLVMPIYRATPIMAINK